MLFFLVVRLVAIPSIPRTIPTPVSRHQISDIASGVLLGMLEDLLTVALLVTSLVAFDRANRFSRYTIERWIGERFCVGLMVKHMHETFRFIVVLALVAAALAPCAADMVLVRSRLTRLSISSSLGLDHNKSVSEDLSLAKFTVIGTAIYAVAVTLIFVFVIDFGQCTPKMRPTNCRKSLDSSYLTPTYLHLGFPGYKSPPQDMEATTCEETDSSDERDHGHVTIVSAPSSCTSEDVEQGVNTEFASTHDGQPRTQIWRRSWIRNLLGASIVMGTFSLVAFVVCAISKDASPLVAAVALNATLNELFRHALGTQFMPSSLPTTTNAESASAIYSRLVRM